MSGPERLPSCLMSTGGAGGGARVQHPVKADSSMGLCLARIFRLSHRYSDIARVHYASCHSVYICGVCARLSLDARAPRRCCRRGHNATLPVHDAGTPPNDASPCGLRFQPADQCRHAQIRYELCAREWCVLAAQIYADIRQCVMDVYTFLTREIHTRLMTTALGFRPRLC